MAFDPTNPNLKLWLDNEKSDPAFTKPITGKSYTGTSLNPTYVVKRLTEAFGPVGWGWGYTAEFEALPTSDTHKLSICRLMFWYFPAGRPPIPAKAGHIQPADPREIEGCAWFHQVGGTDLSGLRSSGKAFADEDGHKKSLTDAITKAASHIGIGGDIFLGRFDDSKYVADRRDEAQAEAKASEAKGAAAKTAELTQRADTVIAYLDNAGDQAAYLRARADALALRTELVAAKLTTVEAKLGAAVKAAATRFAQQQAA